MLLCNVYPNLRSLGIEFISKTKERKKLIAIYDSSIVPATRSLAPSRYIKTALSPGR
jgi:hypothetical protein